MLETVLWICACVLTFGVGCIIGIGLTLKQTLKSGRFLYGGHTYYVVAADTDDGASIQPGGVEKVLRDSLASGRLDAEIGRAVTRNNERRGKMQ